MDLYEIFGPEVIERRHEIQDCLDLMKRRSRDVEELSKVLDASATRTLRNIESNTVHSAPPLVSQRVSLALGKSSDRRFRQDGEPASVLPGLEIFEVAHTDKRETGETEPQHPIRASMSVFSRLVPCGLRLSNALAPCALRLATWGS